MKTQGRSRLECGEADATDLALAAEVGGARPCSGWGPGEPQGGVKLGCGMTGDPIPNPRPRSAPTLAPTTCPSLTVVPSTLVTSCLSVISLPMETEERSRR